MPRETRLPVCIERAAYHAQNMVIASSRIWLETIRAVFCHCQTGSLRVRYAKTPTAGQQLKTGRALSGLSNLRSFDLSWSARQPLVLQVWSGRHAIALVWQVTTGATLIDLILHSLLPCAAQRHAPEAGTREALLAVQVSGLGEYEPRVTTVSELAATWASPNSLRVVRSAPRSDHLHPTRPRVPASPSADVDSPPAVRPCWRPVIARMAARCSPVSCKPSTGS